MATSETSIIAFKKCYLKSILTKNPKIVIIGAGFGGLEFVKKLHKKSVEVLLIDRNNYHNFQPLMYQVATG